jgi:cellulose synthase/poly-beta-1,6-N-acetylglucosamine synthase-like glycosyltransferase
VVADNCSDDTATVARNEGVEVIERHNLALRGKGYALDFGLQYLKDNPPQVVIVLDADCLPETGVLMKLATRASSTGRPVQALYLMKNMHSPSLKEKIAEFAWLVKNLVRPKGLHNMGLPCHLTGSGMAFTWETLQGVSLATGNIVEDMKLGMTLTTQGKAPLFSEDTVVTSAFPSNSEGLESQRTRWEHGHLAMMWDEGLPKLAKGLYRRDSALTSLAMDLCIPPLALLVSTVLAWQGVMALYGFASGNFTALVISLVYLLALAGAVGLAWHRFGRAVVTGRELMKVPAYVLAKLPLYGRFLSRRQAEWVRSKRDNETK